MSRWRPAAECIYVIGDLHGRYLALEAFLNRILPLRKKDKLIFLGDYIDRGPYSAQIVDRLIQLKEKFGDRVTFLMGNHEWFLLSVLGKTDIDLNIPNIEWNWINNGGLETIRSYEKLLDVPKISIIDLEKYIPETHIEFLSNLELYHETDDYIFVHAGCDPTTSLNLQEAYTFLWDRSFFNHCRANDNFNWDKTVICGHNSVGPIIKEKYIMIDASKDNKSCCIELNSMECFVTENKEKRMLRYIF